MDDPEGCCTSTRAAVVQAADRDLDKMIKITFGALNIELHDADLSLVNTKLNAILRGLQASREREVTMSVEMDALQAAVTRNTTLDGSMIELLNGIAAQLLATAGDRAAALALAGELNAKSDALAAAVAANTPATPPA
jgi:hypothetical protein